jgi:cell division protein FtsB
MNPLQIKLFLQRFGGSGLGHLSSLMTGHGPGTALRSVLHSRYLAGWALAVLSLITFGALGIVGLRQKTMQVAHHCYELEHQLQTLERKNAFLSSKIAQLESPRFLQKKISQQLRPVASSQVVWVKDRPVQATHTQGHPLSQPNMVALHLATLKKTQAPSQP